MIDLIKDKQILSKDPKLQPDRSTILFDKFRTTKFTAACASPKLSDQQLMYLGLSNGQILIVPIIVTKSEIKFGEFTPLKAPGSFELQYRSPEAYGHHAPVTTIICVKIEEIPLVFSGGVDGKVIIWYGLPELNEKKTNHHIATILDHKGTVMALAYCKSKNILVTSSNDMTVRIYKADKKFDIIENPRFECKQIIKDFRIQINKDRESPYYISTMSIKETDIIELVACDTKGRALFYYYVDKDFSSEKLAEVKEIQEGMDTKFKDFDEQIKDIKNDTSKSKEERDVAENTLLKEFVHKIKKGFYFVREVNLHKTKGTIKIMHSTFDSVIYSCGFDNHVTCYNTKNNAKAFEIANSNNKTHFTTLNINYIHQELIIADNTGNITFVKIFNKEEMRIKAVNNQIFFLQNFEFFTGQEHLIVVSEEIFTIFKVGRKTKETNKQHHENEIFKIFSIDPVKVNNKIVEDAKLISAGYDNLIKMWDFSSMECINCIQGPELSKKNVDVTAVCYLPDSNLIAVGTDIGNMFFWDLNRSEYLKNIYEKYFKHKTTITDIITFQIQAKNSGSFKEHLISTSKDGFLLLWEIQKTEIRVAKKETNYEEYDKIIMQNSYLHKKGIEDFMKNYNKSKLEPTINNLINYKCIPQIKININGSSILHKEIVFNKAAFHPTLKNFVIYVGCNDKKIHLFDFNKGNHLKEVDSTNRAISCMIFDKNFLITGGFDGYIDLYNLSLKAGNRSFDFENEFGNENEDQKEQEGAVAGKAEKAAEDIKNKFGLSDYELEKLNSEEERITIMHIGCIKDPLIDSNNNVIINDIIMLPSPGILVSCNNLKVINFWRYEEKKEKRFLTSIKKQQFITCLAAVESYGKLVCGTKEKAIEEVDLCDLFNNAGIENDYTKEPYSKNEINYLKDTKDNQIDINDIMKSLNEIND